MEWLKGFGQWLQENREKYPLECDIAEDMVNRVNMKMGLDPGITRITREEPTKGWILRRETVGPTMMHVTDALERVGELGIDDEEGKILWSLVQNEVERLNEGKILDAEEMGHERITVLVSRIMDASSHISQDEISEFKHFIWSLVEENIDG